MVGERRLTEFTVAGALVELGGELLLVRNLRRSGSTDWSTPGGVIDPDDESLQAGLAREVEEETGLRVTAWEGPLYEVRATARDLGWTMRCEVHRALAFEGEISVDDPDGIVVEARFAGPDACLEFLAPGARWVVEPLAAWIGQRWGPAEPRRYCYDVLGTRRDALEVIRTEPA
jgi:ADP-ribose pyrophosphatase YjhB (NUDIX family)